MASQSIHSGHRKRMRQKYQKIGIENFEEHEILEILLYYALPMKDTNQLAHSLINQFGSIAGVLDAPHDVLFNTELSENAVFLLKFLPDLLSLYMNERFNYNNKVLTVDKLPEKFINKFLGKNEEITYLLLLDSKFREIYCGIISKGTKNATDMNIQKICELAVHHKANYAIIAHNHPSGNTLPSNADIVATTKLYQSLFSIGVLLLDHFVVAENDCVSLNDAHVFFKSKEEYLESSYYKHFCG